MADARERVAAEFENIDNVLKEMPGADSIGGLSSLELAGVAAVLHSLYNGIENILKQLVELKGIAVPDGPSWHRELLTSCVSRGMIREATAEGLKEYLGFRHFFSHGYSFDIDKERIEPLVEHIEEVYKDFVADVNKVLEGL